MITAALRQQLQQCQASLQCGLKYACLQSLRRGVSSAAWGSCMVFLEFAWTGVDKWLNKTILVVSPWCTLYTWRSFAVAQLRICCESFYLFMRTLRCSSSYTVTAEFYALPREGTTSPYGSVRALPHPPSHDWYFPWATWPHPFSRAVGSAQISRSVLKDVWLHAESYKDWIQYLISSTNHAVWGKNKYGSPWCMAVAVNDAGKWYLLH